MKEIYTKSQGLTKTWRWEAEIEVHDGQIISLVIIKLGNNASLPKKSLLLGIQVAHLVNNTSEDFSRKPKGEKKIHGKNQL